MRRASFDFQRFAADVNATRASRGLTWRRVGVESGVPPSTFTRINKGDGRKPDVNNLAAIASWAGLSLDDYVLDREQVTRSHREQVVGLILSDQQLERTERRALSQVVSLWYDRTNPGPEPLEPELDSDDENLAEHSRLTRQRPIDRTQCQFFRACVEEPDGCTCRALSPDSQ